MTDELLQTMKQAFRTTQSGVGRYEMVFSFPSMEAMHRADQEWHEFRDATDVRTLATQEQSK